MGAKNTKPNPQDLQTFEDQSKTIEDDLETLQLNLKNLSNNLLPRKEVEARLSQVQSNHLNNNERLAQLIETTKEQQQVILDLNAKYTKLFEECYKQQKVLTDLAGKYQEKLTNCEQDLLNTRNKLYGVEREIITNSEYSKNVAIRKTDNMIKKERFAPRTNMKKDEKGRPSPNIAQNKAKEKLQNARNLRKIEKEVDSLPKNKGFSNLGNQPIVPNRVIEEIGFPEIDCVSETFMKVDLVM